MERIVSSAGGVTCAELITLPICTIKTIYQVENIPIRESIKKIIKNPSVIFKASVPAVLTQIYNSVYKYTLFNYLQQFFDKTWQLLLLGSFTSMSCLLISHPLDYIRVCFQTNKPLGKEIWKGIRPNLMKQAIAGMLYLPLRQSIKNNYPDLPSWQAGLIAATVGTTIVHPFDYYKTYLLGNETGSKIDFRKSFRGIHLNLMRVIPHFLIMTELSDYFYSKIV